MIEILNDVPEGTVGIRLGGKIDADEYKATIEPAIEAALATNAKINALIVVGADGVDLSLGAMWEDMKLGLSHARAWNKAALVAPKAWWDKLVPVMSAVMPGEFRSFQPDEMAEARAWLSAEGGSTSTNP